MQQNSTKVARTSRRTMLVSIGALLASWTGAGALRRFLAPTNELSSHAHDLGPLDAIVADGARQELTIGGTRVLIARRGNEVRVIDLTCTHARCPLEVHIPSRRIRCACHGGSFDLDGNVLNAPPVRPLQQHDARVVEGNLYVRIHKEQA